MRAPTTNPLPLPLGEVAERSEVGEGANQNPSAERIPQYAAGIYHIAQRYITFPPGIHHSSLHKGVPMKNIPDHPVIRSLEATGHPPWHRP